MQPARQYPIGNHPALEYFMVQELSPLVNGWGLQYIEMLNKAYLGPGPDAIVQAIDELCAKIQDFPLVSENHCSYLTAWMNYFATAGEEPPTFFQFMETK